LLIFNIVINNLQPMCKCRFVVIVEPIYIYAFPTATTTTTRTTTTASATTTTTTLIDPFTYLF